MQDDAVTFLHTRGLEASNQLLDIGTNLRASQGPGVVFGVEVEFLRYCQFNHITHVKGQYFHELYPHHSSLTLQKYMSKDQ
jgi:hypothetical protein